MKSRKIYAVEKYELHAQVYYVQAESLAEAIQAIDERGIADNNGPSLLQTADTNGMDIDQFDAETLAELTKGGFDLDDGIVRGIRSAAELKKGSEEFEDALAVLDEEGARSSGRSPTVEGVLRS
jgi:hypothetical protein